MTTPLSAKKRCAICLACGQNYIDYTYITVHSIAEHLAEGQHCEVVILCTGVADYKKKFFNELARPNLSIRFYSMDELAETFGLYDFFTSAHITLSAYFRFFIPQLFSEYDRVLYLDGDIIVQTNAMDIFEEELGDSLLGVVRDTGLHNMLDIMESYTAETLHLDWHDYFNAGVLLYNIPRCLEFRLQEKCFEAQKQIKSPILHDQDILNTVTRGNTFFLSVRWNFETRHYTPLELKKFQQHRPQLYEEYLDAAREPAFLHYAGGDKVWSQPSLPFAELWWDYARRSPFYEKFMAGVQANSVSTILASLKENSERHISTLAKHMEYCLELSKQNSGENTSVLAKHMEYCLQNFDKELRTYLQEKEHENRRVFLRIAALSSRRHSLIFLHTACRLLSHITIGKLKKKLIAKRQEIKTQLDFLNSWT